MHHVPTRAELLAALDDPDDRNPLAAQIAAVIASYGNALAEQANRAGAVPQPLILPMPTTELEAFALELFTEDIRMMGIRISLQTEKLH